MPQRERYLFVCTNRREEGNPKGSCAQKGSEEILDKLKARIAAIGGKQRIRACSSGCLDMCETGASIVLEPDHVVYGRVTLADVDEIAQATLDGRVVERLVVAPPKGK
ncbi:MAG TPA: (2Fe-2S) ferredoxin domain-containing protein [Polyangiaceae bacterium]|nr:(2Fe-2S) ferredoxin domain-containing protein [Polyangiaceae bacterium]